MLHIVAWLAVYTGVLFLLGEAIRPWRTRHWFKLLFFPGVLIAIGVQAFAATLCVGGNLKFAPLKEGQAAFFMQKNDVPYLAGGLFVLVSHALFFALFFLTVRLFESPAGFDPSAIALPSLYPHAVLEGRIDGNATDYFTVFRAGVGTLKFTPAPFLLLLYFAVPIFANLRLRAREFFWAGVLIIALGIAYFGNWAGLGFPFLSRGWLARFFYVPDWWGIFSLYVALALVALPLPLLMRTGKLLVPAVSSHRHGPIMVKLGHEEDDAGADLALSTGGRRSAPPVASSARDPLAGAVCHDLR